MSVKTKKERTSMNLEEIIEMKAKTDGQYAVAFAITHLARVIEENFRYIGRTEGAVIGGKLIGTMQPGCLEKIAMEMEELNDRISEVGAAIESSVTPTN
jgi:hypothetical protein